MEVRIAGESTAPSRRDLAAAAGLLEAARALDAVHQTAERVAERVATRAATGAATRGAPHLEWRGLTGASRAWLLAALGRELRRPFVWVLADAAEADAAREDLEFFLGRDGVLGFPEPETPPYESRAPHPEIVSQRLGALAALAGGSTAPVVTTVRALAQRVPGRTALGAALLRLREGEAAPLDKIVARLAALGYERQPAVSGIGEFAVRGGIVDVFPIGAENPWRIELDDEEIASLRRFDVLTQRSIESATEILVLPRYEVAVLPEHLPAIARRLEEQGDRSAGDARDATRLVYEGVERFAGHYDQRLTTVWSYFDEGALVVLDRPDRLHERASGFDAEVRAHYDEAARHFALLSPPETLFAPALDALAETGGRPVLSLTQTAARSEDGDGTWSFGARPPEAFGRRMDLVRGHLERLAHEGIESAVLCDNAGQRDRLSELLDGAPASFGVGILSAGFVLPEAGVAVLTDHEIFERPRRHRRRARHAGGLSLSELNALKPGDRVVHADHGIGIYRGLRRLTMDQQETDCVELSYAAGDKLFVPVTQLSAVSRYAAEEGVVPTLHRLGSPVWAKTKARAKKAIQDMAQGLLRAYAERQVLPGHAFDPDTPWQRELEASFIYEETPDQLRAVREVKEDMESARPMDRLVCGDVGFGKTEVAVRAAFKAVAGGKQVAVLVPTTILAQQHFHTIRERLAGFPVRIEMLSRFRTAREQKQVVAGLLAGQVDVVIGTHRLLSKDVQFADLGLVVVDEEQRFGVRHKERLRQMRRRVDVLTLSATPIPRTLHFSLAGARDMSLIETPPRDRQPVFTEVAEYSEELIVEALLRELDRGGQTFFVHNLVETIDQAAARLARLLPQMRIAVAHGQMAERALEKVMLEFYERRYDVLVCTMIVENGLDLPNANTLVVDRAQALGLAQLYQLRGRVGRSEARAYAYFLVPEGRVLTEEAEKRLKIIEAFDELGAGFRVALKDLEIRGAGNLLGPEQHGFVAGLGFDLYMKLLEETVANLKGEPTAEQAEPSLATDRPAFLPETYVPDDEEKLEFYRRLAVARRPETVDDLGAELADRFGAPPPPVQALLGLRRLRLVGREGGVSRIRLEGESLEFWLARPLAPPEIAALLDAMPFPLELLSGRELGVRARPAFDEGLAAATILAEALATRSTRASV